MKTRMPRFTVLLVTFILTAIAMMVGAGSAQAAATCTIHSGALYKWSEQLDTLGYNADFKCGGAENTKFRIKVTVQQNFGSDQNPDWQEPNCDAGPCHTYKPGASSWFDAGTEHSWTGTFNYAGQIDGWQFRIKYDAIFQNGDPNQTWFSSKVTV